MASPQAAPTWCVPRRPARPQPQVLHPKYAFRKEYASFDSYVKHHNFANLDYVYSTLSNHDGEYPVDYEAFAANPTGFTVIACNALDGSAKYFDKSDVHYDDFNIMKLRRPCPWPASRM